MKVGRGRPIKKPKYAIFEGYVEIDGKREFVTCQKLREMHDLDPRDCTNVPYAFLKRMELVLSIEAITPHGIPVLPKRSN